ncbi:MAG: hypothetical protein ABW210_03905, partial [Achromobacter sp.]
MATTSKKPARSPRPGVPVTAATDSATDSPGDCSTDSLGSSPADDAVNAAAASRAADPLFVGSL